MRGLLVLTLFFTFSCGKKVFVPNPISKTLSAKCGDNRGDGRKVVGCLEITVSKSDDAASIVYVSAVNENFQIDESQLTVSLSQDENTLSLGNISVTKANTNKTKICGTTNDQQCTSAIIRVFTTELSGYAGVSGFVNKTDNYGVPVKVTDNNSTKQTVGLSATNAAIADTIDITNRKKISLSNWNTTTFPAEVDFSNAGYGNYEMTLTVEMALGN